MRRARRHLVAALAASLLATGLFAWLLSDDGCGLLCTDRITFDPVAILPMIDADLGITTPPGIRTHAAREGGFQDRFVQIRLSTNPAGLDALLAELGLTRADLAPEASPALGPPGPAWWDVAGGGFRTVALTSPRLDHLILAIRPDPETAGRWQIFLWGFET